MVQSLKVYGSVVAPIDGTRFHHLLMEPSLVPCLGEMLNQIFNNAD